MRNENSSVNTSVWILRASLLRVAPECLEPESIQASCPKGVERLSPPPPHRSEVTPEEMGTDPRREPSPPRGGRRAGDLKGEQGTQAAALPGTELSESSCLLRPPWAGRMACGASPGPGEAARRGQWAQDALRGGFLPPRARRRLPPASHQVYLVCRLFCTLARDASQSPPVPFPKWA